MMDLSIKNRNKQNEECNHNIDFPSGAASDSFALNNRPRLNVIKRTKELRPYNYLFQPVDPHQFSSYNNNGICLKVIEYVLETEKKRLTDQISENTHGANFSDSIDKYAPVNYGTITKNNQVSIPSGPNIQHRPETIPSMIITNNGAKKKCIPRVPTSQLTPENKTMYENSVQIFNFSKTSEPVESTSNNEQNGFPQIYNSNSQIFNFSKTSEPVESTSNNEQNGFPQIYNSQIYNSNSQHNISSFAKYMPKILDTRFMPNPGHFENWEQTAFINHSTYDAPMFSSFQFTNEAENHYLSFQEGPESIPPVSFN